MIGTEPKQGLLDEGLLSIPTISYMALLLNIFSVVFKIERSQLEAFEGKYILYKLTEIDEKYYHWLEVVFLILSEVSRGDNDVEEIGHCVLQSMNKRYSEDTLLPEQHLIMIWNNLPQTDMSDIIEV